MNKIFRNQWLPACLLSFWPVLSVAERTVVVQIPWYHQFQFAGFYAAQAQGYYAEAGLNVEIRAGRTETGGIKNPVEEVVFQRADFGVTRSDLLVHHSRGLPLIMLAPIMQRNPAALITLESSGITRLEDIQEQVISLELNTDKPDVIIDVEVLSAMSRARVDIKQLNNQPDTWDVTDLQDGKTNLILGYLTDEPYILKRRGYRPVTISPMDYGIDFYGDILFTSEYALRRIPEAVAAFRKATLQGWDYALAHPQETAEYIIAHYPARGPDYDLDFLLAEAEATRDFIQADLVEIGYSNPERWKRIHEVYSAELATDDPIDLERFLYTERMQRTPWWHWPLMSVITGFLVISSCIMALLFRTRRTLQRQVRISEKRAAELRREAETDALTGLHNRRRFSIELEMNYLRARQDKRPLSLIMLDLDLFKIINDEYGHMAGDQVLRALAEQCRSVLRSSDVLCRFGGEEFAFILPGTELQTAFKIGQRLMNKIRHDQVPWQQGEIRYTVSIGITALKTTDEAGSDLLQRADTLLYEAKAAGRDNIATDAA